MAERADIAIVGAGAAGLFAGIWAARRARELGHDRRILVLDGAAKIGAKILVAGGGRCNVTHHAVTERDFNAASTGAVRSVLARFGVADTVAFFREMGLELKREETGKLFPVTDRARDVLDALLRALRESGAELRHPARAESIEREADGFVIRGAWGEIRAGRLILATGGRSLPKTGSDGAGYEFARALGHGVTRTFPALVPLTLADGHFLRDLSGVSFPATLEVRSASGKRQASTRGDALCTHFGLSGPAVLDISRHLIAARHADAGARLVVSFVDADRGALEGELVALGPKRVASWLRGMLPERLGGAILAHAGVAPETSGATLTRDARRALLAAVCELDVPVTGDRGYTYAEVTAGGVPLSELTLRTMESRVCPGLRLCGEILDVDGRIGGFNFQWAWASGFSAGRAAAE
ncbi:MAG: NAD(P)/FAD-dependent oxidoreductase [Phycisphaeraceae bacterium]|nr:NAD(P)/FAD-dependent oxidoreductase [Phycisphaeraceae bacterium]